MSELKTCPFCGGEAVRLGVLDNPRSTQEKGYRFFGCRKCCVVSFSGMTKTEAIAAWNRRANDGD